MKNYLKKNTDVIILMKNTSNYQIIKKNIKLIDLYIKIFYM